MSKNYAGDFPASHTGVTLTFDSFAAATGASSAASNFVAGDVQIYKDGGTTQRSSSAGITVTTSFDSNTGLQMIVIDTSDNTDAGFYATGHEYDVAVADVTIDAQTVRFWAGSFSIERAGGVLALLKGSAVKVDVNTIKTNPVVNAGTVTFPTGATLASTTNITAGTIATVTNLTNAPTAGDLTATMKTSVTTAATAATPIAASVTGAVGSVTGAVGSVTGAVGSVTGNVGGNVVGSVASVTARVTANSDQVAGSAAAATNLSRGTLGVVLGTVGSASSTTSVVTSSLDPAAAVIDQYKGRIVTFDRATTTTNLRGQSTDITGNTALGVLTVTALTTAPVSGDTFTIT